MKRENVQYGKMAEQFREGALSIIPLYDIFWRRFIEERNRKWLRTLSVSKEKARKIASLALSGSLKDSTKVKLGQFLNPSREYVYEITAQILTEYNDTNLQHFYDDYLNNVVHPILKGWKPWLLSVAKSNMFSPVQILFEDRLSYVIIGFLRGVHKYDFNSDNSITTVCYNWIKDTVANGVFEERSIAHVPYSLRVKAVAKDESSMGKIAGVLNGLSLDTKVNSDGEGATFQDFITYKTELVSSNTNELREHLNYLLKNYLATDEYQILIHKFGLIDGEPRTNKEIKEILGLSQSTIKKKLDKAISKLKCVPDLRETLYEIVSC